MKPVKDNYPVFEANQVLTNIHLNDIFSYLDEQERLTRANLIGIGIVCGLEIRHEIAGGSVTVHISKGCGITSEGYLIVEPNDVALVSYRRYTLPADLEYPPFKDLTLWEMFPEGEPGTTSLNDSPDFLNDNVVVLFLELKKEKLRNCSPINCDDKGAQVTATVRRLLIERDALNYVITEANQLGANLTFADLEVAMLARLNLPDLRLPRLGIPNRDLATSNDVFAAFLSVFQVDDLVSKTGDALRIAYHAFRPVVKEEYPSDPFTPVFEGKFGFLTTAPKETSQVRFLQYYYDFFDDLIKAYDEFRWKGVELMCVCCPPEGLFPRHLMLGELYPEAATSPGIYRHSFLASSGIGGCDERIKDLKLLFQRLVEMIIQFTDIRRNILEALTDTEIRITPSQLGDVPLGNKAIPYYYQQNGSPPLYHLWNAEKNRRNRANQNLSYRSYEYENPAEVPAFVRDALRYDLEPYNFLRIEGHLGKDYRSVLYNLLSLKSAYRLPIEIIALRTGVFDDKIPVDLDKEKCRFQDLEALYDALREELRCFLAKELVFFYDLPYQSGENTEINHSEVPLLQEYQAEFLVKAFSIGELFEKHYKDNRKSVWNWVSVTPPGMNVNFHGIIYQIVKLDSLIRENLDTLDITSLIQQGKALEDLVNNILSEDKTITENINDHLEAILFNCHLDAFRSIHAEYRRRFTEAKRKQFLSFFLQSNPGIQHKAGVPLGGTFIIVYHEDPEAELIPSFTPRANLDAAPNRFAATVNANRPTTIQINDKEIRDILSDQFGNSSVLHNNPKFDAIVEQILDFGRLIPSAGGEASQIIEDTINGLADGTVIADFFLPYLCCSDCSPVQYVLPTPPLGIDVQIGCTDEKSSEAEITIIPGEGTAPFTYQLDGKESEELPAEGTTITLRPDNYTLIARDSAGRESVPRILSIFPPLEIKNENYSSEKNIGSLTVSRIENNKKYYRLVCDITGGKPPYSPGDDGAWIEGNKYYHPDEYESDQLGVDFEVMISDAVGCERKKTIKTQFLF